MVNISRSNLESDLAKALSRHIGYTTGAYYIDRIASITAEFRDKPSLYQFELTRYLAGWSSGGSQRSSEDYTSGIINFAVGLGIIYKVSSGATSRVNRFAITPEGSTIRSALAHEENDLVKFTLTGLVLESDSDAYVLLLDILDETSVSGPALHNLFQDRFRQLRDERMVWLYSAFPNRILRGRIESKTSWADSRTSRTLKNRTTSDRALGPLASHFGRHHVTPRLGWAEWFNHIDRRKASSKADLLTLTPDGRELLTTLRANSSRYTWLGPRSGTQEALRIPMSHQKVGPFSPAWELMRPKNTKDSESAIQTLACHVADFMRTHYNTLKLVHANQAPVSSVLPFIYYQERNLGYQVPTELVLDRLFRPGSSFNALSTRFERYGYFQIRTDEHTTRE